MKSEMLTEMDVDLACRQGDIEYLWMCISAGVLPIEDSIDTAAEFGHEACAALCRAALAQQGQECH